MLLLLINLCLAADPWGRPERARVVVQPPTHWGEIYSTERVFRLWWNETDKPATIEVQGPRGWKELASETYPGWITPPLAKTSIFRITLQDAVRSSPPLVSDTTITPTMLADMSVERGATLSTVMGQIAIGNETCYVATLEGGVVQVNGQEVQNLTTWNGLPDDRVISVAARDDQLLVGTANGAALLQDGLTRFVWTSDLSDSYVQSVAFHQDKLALGTYRGLDMIDDGEIVNILPKWSIFSLLSEETGTLWVGYEGITQLSSTGDATSKDWPGNVYDLLFVDSDLYMATTKRGVVKVTEDGTEVLYKEMATSLAHTNDHLWIAAGENGLINETQDRIDGQRALPKTSVWSVAAQKSTLWVGTEEGLYRWAPTTDSVDKIPNAPWPADSQINDVYSTESGALIASATGIAILGMPEGLSNEDGQRIQEEIIEILEQNNELILVGKQHLFVRGPFEFEKVPLPAEPSAAALWLGRIWIATSNGLYTWNTTNRTLTKVDNNATLLKLQSTQHSLWGVDKQGLLWEIKPNKLLVFARAGTALDAAPSGYGVCVGTTDGLVQVYKGREEPVQDTLESMDVGVSITAVATSETGGCWLAGEDGSIGRTREGGDVLWYQLPQPDPPRVLRIVPDKKDRAWIITEKGTWLIELPW